MQRWQMLAAFVGSQLIGASAHAHDDALWIERNPRYLSADGKHCCGPGDCKRWSKEHFRRDGDSIYYLPTMQKFGLNGPGIYQSETGDWWACTPGGNQGANEPQQPFASCIFVPFHSQ